MKIEHENTFKQALKSGINLFVGSGFSILANDPQGNAVPTGPELANRWHNLASRLQSHPTLFWGTSINDSGSLEALNPKTIQSRPQKDKWAVLPDAADNGSAQYFRALGCQLIIATTSDALDYLESLDIIPTPTKSQFRKQPTKNLFPLEAIPDIGTIPVRPIIEFYIGAGQ